MLRVFTPRKSVSDRAKTPKNASCEMQTCKTGHKKRPAPPESGCKPLLCIRHIIIVQQLDRDRLSRYHLAPLDKSAHAPRCKLGSLEPVL